jgi:hypothetical protein
MVLATTNIYVLGEDPLGAYQATLREGTAPYRAQALCDIWNKAARGSNTPMIPTRGAPRGPLVELDGRREIGNILKLSMILSIPRNFRS